MSENTGMIHIMGPNSKSRLTNVEDNDVQPNAVDLKVKELFRIHDTLFLIDEENREHRETSKVPLDEDGYWVLEPGSYEIIMDNNISVGMGEAGWVITRSSLNRNSVHLSSGLYDSGYEGIMAACMHVNSGSMKIKPGTRVGQYISFKSEALHAYDGAYGFNADGTPKEMEAKYHN